MRISDWSSDVCSSDLLIHGGTSGIGTTAIQLANAFGISPIVTCGSDEKCRAALEIGAHHAINYRTEDFVERVKEITVGRGVDVVLDKIGRASCRERVCQYV